jgi:hypothetical protein
VAKRKKTPKKAEGSVSKKSKTRSSIKSTKSTKESPQKYKHLSRYNRILQILSAYKKQNNVDFKGKSFSKIASEIYQSTKNSPLKQIEVNIDVLYTKYSGIIPSGLQKEAYGLRVIDYWEITRAVSTLADEVPIFIDNSVEPQVLSFEGSAGEFTRDFGYSIVAQINRIVRGMPKDVTYPYVYIPSVSDDSVVWTLTYQADERLMTDAPTPPEAPITKPSISDDIKQTQKELREITEKQGKVIKEQGDEIIKLRKELNELKKAKSTKSTSKKQDSQNKKLKKETSDLKKKVDKQAKELSEIKKMLKSFLGKKSKKR